MIFTTQWRVDLRELWNQRRHLRVHVVHPTGHVSHICCGVIVDTEIGARVHLVRSLLIHDFINAISLVTVKDSSLILAYFLLLKKLVIEQFL